MTKKQKKLLQRITAAAVLFAAGMLRRCLQKFLPILYSLCSA